MSHLVWISLEADLLQVQTVVLRGKTMVERIRREIRKGRQARKSALLSQLPRDKELKYDPTGEFRYMMQNMAQLSHLKDEKMYLSTNSSPNTG